MKHAHRWFWCCLWIGLALASHAAPPSRSSLHVAPSGLDLPHRGSVAAPLQTIQYAIDQAGAGATVIVLEGHYTGPGNTNLIFPGKPVVLRSREPSDPASLRNTILDARGMGLIARFRSGTTYDTVMTGFTLVPGDTSVPVNGGARGLFEIPPGATPIIDRIRLTSAALLTPRVSQAEEFRPMAATPPLGSIIWDGSDPFHRPVPSMRYYGSGDLDGDGKIDLSDVSILEEIVKSTRAPSPEADVDGDGNVDAQDRDILLAALAGKGLPAAWDSLTSRPQRESWVLKALALDPTDVHTPYAYWNQCGGFAMQTFLNFAYYGGDLHTTYFGSGATRFNIPFYQVAVYSESFGHAINAVLVGEDPLNFADWLFLEPQNDQIVRPGMWDMPFDTDIVIQVPQMLYQGGWEGVEKVKFHLSEARVTLLQHSQDLLLYREPPFSKWGSIYNAFWNPFLIPHNDGLALVGANRSDFSTGNHEDIFVSSFWTPTQAVQQPLLGIGDYARLLDVAADAQGVVHLLWKGKEDALPGVFYGQLDLLAKQIVGKVRLSEGPRAVRMGRLLPASDGRLHALWMEYQSNSQSPYPSGIYWTTKAGSAWKAAENLAPLPFLALIDVSNWWNRPDVLRYYFDVEEMQGGGLLLVWNEPKNPPNLDARFFVKSRIFMGDWTPTNVLVDEAGALGVALARDSSDQIHLVFSTDMMSATDNHGKLFHRVSNNGREWRQSERLDGNGNACCPRLSADLKGNLFVAFMERRVNKEQGMWRRLSGSSWSSIQKLGGESSEVWYPNVWLLPDGSTGAMWSSRGENAITVESQILSYHRRRAVRH